MRIIVGDSYRIFSGDCITGAEQHIADNSIDLIISDPPYGISGDQLHRHYKRKEEYVIDGYVEISEDEYARFSLSWLTQAERVLRPGGSLYVISGYSNLIHILNALKATSLKEINHIIWKYNFGVYTRKKYVSSHYHVLYYTKPGANVTFNTFSRFSANEKLNGKSLNYSDREDVWIINRDYKPGRIKNKNELPLSLLTKIIQYSSDPGDMLADFFMGGFSTAIAAIRLGRQFTGFEINPVAFDRGAEKLKSLQSGYIAQTNQNSLSPLPKNLGRPWSSDEDHRLRKRYHELRSTLKTKKKIVAQLQTEFERGYFAIMNRLKMLESR